MYQILLCDDEKDIVTALEIYLRNDDYKIFKAYNGADALKILTEEEIHLVLLDIMMPHMDGIAALTKLREFSNVPVILLTAKSEDIDKVLGLTVGADDYITKPFNPIELQARVKSQLRRYMQLGGGKTQSDVYSVGGIVLNPITKEVTLDSDPIALTRIEYNILLFLCSTSDNPLHHVKSTKTYGTTMLMVKKALSPYTSDTYEKKSNITRQNHVI